MKLWKTVANKDCFTSDSNDTCEVIQPLITQLTTDDYSTSNLRYEYSMNILF